MGEFFKGWRRKMGVLTLVMACVFAAGWVRSQETADSIYIVVCHREYCFSSETGQLGISEFDDEPDYPWEYPLIRSSVARHDVDIPQQPFFFKYVRDEGMYSPPFSGIRVSYSPIVLPLTLLSAYLLLVKPRHPTTSVTQPDPTAAL